MSGIDGHQPRLDLKVVRDPVPAVSMQVIRQQPSYSAAIILCVQASGLNHDQICAELEIDPGHFSRMMKGTANFPDNKLVALMEVCGNEIPLIWLADHQGYRLERLQSALEEELAQERAKNAELELKLSHFAEFEQLRAGRA
ncbi:MAG: hypothetical protein AAGI72_23565 [Pseudomonadota bacterium]